jgi:hypothetical protein
VAQPHRYRLLFGPPVPGYDAHAERLNDASQASMDLLVDILSELGDATPPGRALASDLGAWAKKRRMQVNAATALRAILIWSRVHGFVSLEIAGNFASMGIDPDRLFEIELSAVATRGSDDNEKSAFADRSRRR